MWPPVDLQWCEVEISIDLARLDLVGLGWRVHSCRRLGETVGSTCIGIV